MPSEPETCSRCGEEVPDGALACPACGTPVREREAAPEVPPPPVRPPPVPPGAPDFSRRLARLAQLQQSAAPLGVTMPTLPEWAEEFARDAPDAERWSEVVRGIERIAQQRVVRALEEWERHVKHRLGRLEAYSVDGRLERDQIDDILHAARTGDLSLSLTTYQQVDRVVALKERHLDQAREELERLVSLLRDMQALGLPTPQDPSEISEDMERELRSGRLASLKQQLRALRTQAIGRLKVSLPNYVSQYGDFLLRERTSGVPIELETAELARGARDFVRGKPEESLRRLRVLAQVHGSPSGRTTGAARPKGPSGDGPGPTGAARTA